MVKLYDSPEVCRTYFFPMHSGPLPITATAQPHQLRLPEQTRIGAYWSRPLRAAPTVLYLHGNGECIGDQLGHWPKWAQDGGYNMFYVDYPGYATSEGRPTFTSCCHAALAAARFLLEQPADEVPAIVLMGRSVGSIFALHCASASADDRIRGLVLESGVADVSARLAMRVPFEQWGLDRNAIEQQVAQDFDHQAKLQRLRCPVLVLHARGDSIVPAANGEQLAAWAGPALHRLVLFDEGDHNSIQLLNAVDYQRELADFVAAVAGDVT